jgi:hypothetical protein
MRNLATSNRAELTRSTLLMRSRRACSNKTLPATLLATKAIEATTTKANGTASQFELD